MTSSEVLGRSSERSVVNGSAYDPRPRQALPVDEGAPHRPPPFPTVLALDPTLPLGDLIFGNEEEERPSQIASSNWIAVKSRGPASPWKWSSASQGRGALGSHR